MIEGYFGFPLFSKENKPVGILVGMDCKVLANTEKIERLFSTYSDRVTAEMGRTKSEKVRKELVKRFEHIGNNTPGIIYQFKLMPDGTMCFPYASSGIKDIYGVTPDQVKHDATLAFNAVHFDDLEQVRTSIRESAENMTQWHDTHRVYLPSGEMIWVEGNSSPELEEDGSVLWHGFIQNITKRKQVDKEIRSLLDVTKEQNDRLRNFAQVISHNLRSHSAGISGILKLVDLEFPAISQHELIKFLNRGADNLNQTVNDLNETIKVNFSQNESAPIGIHAILKKNIDSLSLQIKEAGIKIINNVDKDLVVKAVPAYLDSIALNLITNAIKYRSKERASYLKIDAKIEGAVGTILFEDNGQGIDLKKHGDKLFGMYKTFHNHEDSRGVGLFITKNHINSMGGHIKAESQVNEGTTFKITLPK
jgi:PAS domain S-box-containing protein